MEVYPYLTQSGVFNRAQLNKWCFLRLPLHFRAGIESCLFGDWTIVRFKGAETTHHWSGKSASHRTGPKIF